MLSIVGACAVRISRLDADGTPDFLNADGALIICGGISTFEHDFEVEEGEEILEFDACGDPCVNFKRDDFTKRATFTLTLCRTDPRISEIVEVSQALTDGPDIVGHAVQAARGCGTASSRNGVAIELWSEQIECDAPSVETPYLRAVMGRAYLNPAGFTRENGTALPVFNGYAVTNPNFGDGPFGDLDPLTGVESWVYAELDDTVLPTCPDPFDYVPTPSGVS